MATAIVSGTLNIQDNTLQAFGAANLNFGGANVCSIGFAAVSRRSVIRFSTSSIPDGTITGFRINMFRYPDAANSTANGQTGKVYRITDANTWVAGSSSNATETGASDWNYAKHTSQAWAGSVGCGTSGIDYDADASPPSWSYDAYTSGPGYWQQVTLPAQWVQDWKDGTRVNNGIMIRGDELIAGEAFVFGASETNLNPNPVYFEIDYTPNVALGRITWRIPF